MIHVFIAAPYDGSGTQAANVTRAVRCASRLMQEGFAVYLPHLSHFWDIISPHDRAWWLRQSLAWVERSDVLLRLRGESPGADDEVARAQELGLPVFWTVPEVIDWAQRNRNAVT
ncbi:MAG: hypothetical protein ACR2P5_02850 [Gammaproteobacteria bacterium]